MISVISYLYTGFLIYLHDFLFTYMISVISYLHTGFLIYIYDFKFTYMISYLLANYVISYVPTGFLNQCNKCTHPVNRPSCEYCKCLSLSCSICHVSVKGKKVLHRILSLYCKDKCIRCTCICMYVCTETVKYYRYNLSQYYNSIDTNIFTWY